MILELIEALKRKNLIFSLTFSKCCEILFGTRTRMLQNSVAKFKIRNYNFKIR